MENRELLKENSQLRARLVAEGTERVGASGEVRAEDDQSEGRVGTGMGCDGDKYSRVMTS